MIPMLVSFGYVKACDFTPDNNPYTGSYNSDHARQEKVDAAACEGYWQNTGSASAGTVGYSPIPTHLQRFRDTSNDYGQNGKEKSQLGAAKDPKDKISLIEALQYQNYELANQIKQGKVNVNEKDAEGYTPLTLAVMHSKDPSLAEESLKMVDFLIAHNADPTLQRPEHDWLFNMTNDESLKEKLEDYTFDFMSDYRDRNGRYVAPQYDQHGNMLQGAKSR